MRISFPSFVARAGGQIFWHREILYQSGVRRLCVCTKPWGSVRVWFASQFGLISAGGRARFSWWVGDLQAPHQFHGRGPLVLPLSGRSARRSFNGSPNIGYWTLIYYYYSKRRPRYMRHTIYIVNRRYITVRNNYTVRLRYTVPSIMKHSPPRERLYSIVATIYQQLIDGTNYDSRV